MRAWRTPGGFLADLGPTSTGVIHELAALLPEGPWRELHEYAAIDPAGNVVDRYRVSVWSLDDDLGVSTHAVIDGELRCLTVVDSYSGRVRREEQKVMSGLEEISDLAFVREALARQDQLEREAISRAKADGEARVAAIPGALEDFGLGEPFRRAQTVLAKRVRSFGGTLEVELLKTLGAFGRLHRTWGRAPAFEAALDAFAAACRLAAFDPAPRVERFSGEAVDVPELRQALTDAERMLLAAADGQEWADAWRNASEYRKAADLVARARTLLSASIG